MTFTTPVLIVAYKRSDTFSRVIESMQTIKPTKLYVAFDGPKNNDEKMLCKKTQKTIKEIDWKCNVKTNISGKNLGCKQRASSAIDWFFKHETEGVILEDDTLPNASFFFFCQKMLIKYRKNSNIMHISGNNFLPSEWNYDGSYYFSRIPHIWGWATWKRAWQKYDVDMKSFPRFVSKKSINTYAFTWIGKKVLMDYFSKTYYGRIDTWDFQWTYALFKYHGMAINPSVNLVKNIGFSESATHTHLESSFSNMKTYSIDKIKHPSKIEVDHKADSVIVKQNFEATIPKFYFNKFVKLFHRLYYKALLLKQKI